MCCSCSFTISLLFSFSEDWSGSAAKGKWSCAGFSALVIFKTKTVQKQASPRLWIYYLHMGLFTHCRNSWEEGSERWTKWRNAKILADVLCVGTWTDPFAASSLSQDSFWYCFFQRVDSFKWELVFLFGSDLLPLFTGPSKLPCGDSSTQHPGWLHWLGGPEPHHSRQLQALGDVVSAPEWAWAPNRSSRVSPNCCQQKSEFFLLSSTDSCLFSSYICICVYIYVYTSYIIIWTEQWYLCHFT